MIDARGFHPVRQSDACQRLRTINHEGRKLKYLFVPQSQALFSSVARGLQPNGVKITAEKPAAHKYLNLLSGSDVENISLTACGDCCSALLHFMLVQGESDGKMSVKEEESYCDLLVVYFQINQTECVLAFSLQMYF